jgi:putative flippase GtrA
MTSFPEEFLSVVLVDDGSDPSCGPLFARLAAFPGVTLLRHAVNLGKGNALKTGLNDVLCRFPNAAGAVTADADGQHTPADIRRIAGLLDAGAADLILGARRFSRGVPLRSLVGNRTILLLFRLLVGRRLSDTQTGLRGISSRIIPQLLRIEHSGYEFELDMLIMSKHHDWSIAETNIETVYVDGNRSSHFRPLRDSIHISLQLFRFIGVSLATAAIDYAVFATCFRYAGNIAESQIAARLAALFFQFFAVKKVVFFSDTTARLALPAFAGLVTITGILSYGTIAFLNSRFGIPVICAKVISELLIYLGSFAVQRDFIFTRRRRRDI